MSVQLEPSELGFKRPFTQETSETLYLRNTNSDPLAFKVKTTAPKQYCVRPNSGKIEPGQTVQVQVLLQAMKEDPPLEAKCRDKFLVQSVAVPGNQEFADWTSVEKTAKSGVQERKIRVNFLPASGISGTHTPNRMSTASGLHDDEPPAYSSPVSSAVTPVGPVSKPESRPDGSKSVGDAISSAHNPGASGTMATMGGAAAGVATGAAATAASSMPSSEELKAQLNDARATISRLTKQAQESAGLRQRKPESGSSEKTGSPSMTMQQVPPSGVSVPIVAALCLLSFLLAYLFF